MSSSVDNIYGCARIPPIASSKFPREKILFANFLLMCVLCVSLLLFTPALVFTEDAIVASIDTGVTGVAGVVVGGACVAGVAGGTGVPFIGVTLCAEVLFLVVSVVVGVVCVRVVFVLLTRLVRLLGCRSSFCSLVHASRE